MKSMHGRICASKVQCRKDLAGRLDAKLGKIACKNTSKPSVGMIWYDYDIL